jgi:hypothetical protein
MDAKPPLTLAHRFVLNTPQQQRHLCVSLGCEEPADVMAALRDAYDILTRPNDQPDRNATVRALEAAIRLMEGRSLAHVVIGVALAHLDIIAKALVSAGRDVCSESDDGSGEIWVNAEGGITAAVADLEMAITSLRCAARDLEIARRAQERRRAA